MVEVKNYNKDWEKHGVVVEEREAEQLIKIEKEGRKKIIDDFKLENKREK
jgi:hypothetical protein